jgi:hypothetical protein
MNRRELLKSFSVGLVMLATPYIITTPGLIMPVKSIKNLQNYTGITTAELNDKLRQFYGYQPMDRDDLDWNNPKPKTTFIYPMFTETGGFNPYE